MSSEGPETPSDTSYSGEIATAEGGQSERNSTRLPVAMKAEMRRPGGWGVGAKIADLSTHGCKVETHLELQEGSIVWIRLPGLEPTPAKVAWVRGYEIGCAFERPLHPAVLDLIVARSST
jgi:hypothetical protein